MGRFKKMITKMMIPTEPGYADLIRPELWDYYNAVAEQIKLKNPPLAPISTDKTGVVPELRIRWRPVLACNGYIYATNGSTKIYKIDPASGEFFLLGTTINGQWNEGCLANNRKIYFASGNTANVLVVNPDTDTFYTLDIPANTIGSLGFTKIPDGRLLAKSGNQNHLLIDPETDTPLHLFRNFADNCKALRLGSNGNVYFFGDHIYKVDNSLSYNYIASYDVSGASQCVGGKIYFVTGGEFRYIRCCDNYISDVIGAVNLKTNIFCTGSDGCIYCCRSDTYNDLYRINPDDDSVMWLSGLSLASSDGLISYPDGKLYLFPNWIHQHIIEIDISAEYTYPPDYYLTQYVN
ncbi:MAG: hypothetical protein GY754_16845 [bacterium]|nr:hypothetical protein [bacterium]